MALASWRADSADGMQWDEVIPKLLTYYHDKSADMARWDQKAWEDRLLKFLSKFIDLINDEEFTAKLGDAFATQLELYREVWLHHKSFCFRCLGVCMKKSTNKAFIRAKLDAIFAAVEHKEQSERDGCAVGIGYVASSHLDMVLEKLLAVTKNDMVRKSTGFLGLAKDKSELDIERIKSTVLLAFGYSALYAPTTLITSRLDVSILNVVVPLLPTARMPFVKENAVRAVDLICEALQPSRLKDDAFVCKRRAEMLGHMYTYIQAEPAKSGTKSKVPSFAIDACTTMVSMNPKLPLEERTALIQKVSSYILELPAKIEDEEIMRASMESFKRLLATVLSEDLLVANLNELFDVRPALCGDRRPESRARAHVFV